MRFAAKARATFDTHSKPRDKRASRRAAGAAARADVSGLKAKQMPRVCVHCAAGTLAVVSAQPWPCRRGPVMHVEGASAVSCGQRSTAHTASCRTRTLDLLSVTQLGSGLDS